MISFHTESQNDLIGAITVFVISDCDNAAITAIRSIANQKSSRKSCQRAFQLQAKRLSLLGFHFIHFIVSLNHHTLIDDVLLSGHFSIIPHFSGACDSHLAETNINISQKDSAADTYTGTIASEINAVIDNFSPNSPFHSFHKK